MNINLVLICDQCSAETHVRIGLGNREIQPFQFSCLNCTSPINILLELDIPNIDYNLKFEGATPAEHDDLDKAKFYIELNIDFPTDGGVKKGGEVFTLSPFMRALPQIGTENLLKYKQISHLVDSAVADSEEVKSIIRFYLAQKWGLFKRGVHKYLPEEEFPCNKSIDRNKCLYQILELAFLGFIDSSSNYSFVSTSFEELTDLQASNKIAFNKFLKEMLSTGFLKHLQRDCLEVYPGILDADLILRPAIYLDYVKDNLDGLVAARVSSSSFITYKDLFKDISEILSRSLVLVAPH